MKRTLLIVACAAVVTTSAQAQTLLAGWTFETSLPATAGPFAPEQGAQTTGAFASGLHASGATVYSTPAGNGSTHSFSANNWAVGDYFQFAISTVSFSNIFVSYAQGASSTGPANFALAYSSDGGTNFTQLSSYTLANANFSAASLNGNFERTFDLSSVAALNNNANVVFRVIDLTTLSAGGGTVAATGTGRLDDFDVSSGGFVFTGANPVPEPSAIALGTVGLVGLMALRRRRR